MTTTASKGSGPQVRRITYGLTREIKLLAKQFRKRRLQAESEREARRLKMAWVITKFTEQLEIIAEYELPPLEEGYGRLSLMCEMVRDRPEGGEESVIISFGSSNEISPQLSHIVQYINTHGRFSTWSYIILTILQSISLYRGRNSGWYPRRIVYYDIRIGSIFEEE